jgi:cell division protein FtsL
VSFANVLVYICILLLAVLVLTAFFGNRNQVARLRRQVQSLENQLQQAPPSAAPAFMPTRR